MMFFKIKIANILVRTTSKKWWVGIIKVLNLLLVKNKRMHFKSVKYLDLIDVNKRVIYTKAVTKIFLPNYIRHQKIEFIEIESPEVQLLELKNFIISGHSSSFIKDNNLYIERYLNEENLNANYSTGGVRLHNNSCAMIIQKTNLHDVDKGFFLAGNGSWNYYHWLIEILPKLKVYLELELYNKGIKLLVPDSVKESENLRFLLERILGDVQVEVVFLSTHFCYHIKQLYHLTPINNVLFNERKIGIATNILHIRPDSLGFIRDKIGKDVLSTMKDERIFLARKDGGARDYNQTELITLIIKYRFKIIYMEDYSVEQQVSLFKNAKYIIGPSGAAWTNLIFCNKLCKALTWLPESIQKFPAFSTLANFANVELSFFNTSSNHYKNIHDDYIIDLNIFEIHLNKLLE